MKIFAQSATNLADTFLHAGYVSATPSGVALQYPTLHDPELTGHAVSFSEAFSLTTTTVPMEEAVTSGWLEVLGNSGPAAPALLALAAVALAVRLLPRRRLASATASGAIGLMLVGSLSCGYPRGYMEYTGFTYPSEVTFVVLNAVLRDALVQHHDDTFPFEDMADLAEHLSIPADQLGEGTQLALDTLPRDSWDTDIHLEPLPFEIANSEDIGYQYWLTSAGPDGAFETSDDITALVGPEELTSTAEMSYTRRTWYLQRLDGVLWVTTRRVPCSFAHQENWEDHDRGEELWEDYQSVPLEADFITTWLEIAYPYEDRGDVVANIEWVEAFYDTFVTPEDSQPVVVQVFDTTITV